METDAARLPAPHAPPGPGEGEALAMLRRRGLSPRLTPPDLPFPPDLPPDALDAVEERLHHYALRLFLRGAILRPGPFAPAEATRYLSPAAARRAAEELGVLGVLEPAGRGRYRLVRRARSFGGTLEWWMARALRRRLALDVASGVRSGARGVGGDLDVVAAGEGKLVYLELKSSPPKHLSAAELDAFLRRVGALGPDLALFVVDTALRLSDKVLPMFASALARAARPAAAPRRVIRETWALAPGLYAVNARQDLVENVCRAIADGLVRRNPGPG
ncbi:MAG TPA: hypothetical protein VLU43_13030 [Anaeromyxobacteraceae bacterium]|nr:hypothetical protein [Anaeromyxobacteraceae bacterium]